MLITTCTHCLARFKVTPQQLNLRQGQVRCGHCGQVFSGFEALERFPDDDTGTRILAARAAAHAEPPRASVPPDEPAGGVPELETLEPLPELPEAAQGTETDEPAGAPEREPVPAPPVEYAARPRLSMLPDFDPPPPPPRPARAWVFGVVLAFVALGLQLAYAYRSQLAQAYPVTRPWLESACAAAGCVVPWANDAARLKLEDSELLEVPGRPQEIALGARVRNLAAFAQEYPHLELTLTDLTGQAAVRRVLRPVDYLGRAVAAGEVMPASSEFAIQLRLEMPRVKATGYELLLFYP